MTLGISPNYPVVSIANALPSSIATWNARGLLCADPILRRRKQDFLVTLAAKHSITFLQELHGSVVDVEIWMARLRPRYHTVCYLCLKSDGTDDPSAGGVLALVTKSRFTDWQFIDEVLIAGRILRLDFFRDWNGRVQHIFC